MNIFSLLLLKLIPLYSLILLGFVAGKLFPIKKEKVAFLLIYIIVPVIVFNATARSELTKGLLSLPILFFLLCSLTCLFFYFVSKYFWTDVTRHIFAFTSGSGNSGYFGLPVALALFGERSVSIVVLSILGFVLYENSLGFFIVARGYHTTKQALVRLVTLPAIDAFFLGLVVNVWGVQPTGEIYRNIINLFQQAFTLLGMMIIGLAIADVRVYKLDFKFISLTFLAKFVMWPVLVLSIIFLDSATLGLYNSEVQKVMILMSVVPLAANTVAYASLFKAQPEKASVAVLLSTLFALFYIPFVFQFVPR